MSDRIPTPPSRSEAQGVPDPQDATGAQLATGGAEDTGNTVEPPHDTAVAVEDFGTTPAEQHEGESLDGRLAREQPEASPEQPADGSATPYDERAGQGVGRIVEPDEGVRSDTEKDMIAEDVGTDLGGYSAEESAMHLEPEA